MTKAGGIPAFPIAQPETSGNRPLGKSGPSREDAEPGFGFPEHLTDIEGEQSQPQARRTELRDGRKEHLALRSVLADVLAGDLEQRSETDTPAQESITDFVADLRRMLAAGPATSSVFDEAKADANTMTDEQSAAASFEALQNVIALIPQAATRQTSSALRADAPRLDAAEGKVFALPLGPRQNSVLRAEHARLMPAAADETLQMPGATTSAESMELPATERRVPPKSIARTSEADAGLGRSREAITPDVKVTTIRQETHFAPMMRASPAIQIADAVANGLADLETESATRSTFDPTAAKSGSTAPLRVLQVQLQPVELGTVTISMSLKADVLELHLDAARADTADMLRRDREVLSDLLRQAGYDVDSVSVRIADSDAGALSSGSNSPQTAGQHMQSSSVMGQPQGNAATPDDRSRGTRQQTEQGQSTPSEAESGRGPDTPGSRGVYI
jgi:flagellar hook-length control protein FliK